MAIRADGGARAGCRTRYGVAGTDPPGAANDNRSDRATFTFLSSTGGGGAASDRSDPESSGSSRNLRPTDLFDDLAEIDEAFRASVPLCVMRASGRQGK